RARSISNGSPMQSSGSKPEYEAEPGPPRGAPPSAFSLIPSRWFGGRAAVSLRWSLQHGHSSEERRFRSVPPGVWLSAEDGTALGAASPGQIAVRHPVESHLPWAVMAVAPTTGRDVSARRKLLLVLLAALGVFTLAGAYIVIRALRKEFALARM